MKPPSTDEIVKADALALMQGRSVDVAPIFDAAFPTPPGTGANTTDAYDSDMPIPDHLGRYRMLGRLGVGGMADVLLGERTGPGGFSKRVVVKRLLPHLARD